MTSTEGDRVPTTAEFAMLSAARSGRLRRFYYTNLYVDAVTGGLMGGGGKAASDRLELMAAEYGWLEPMPTTAPGFDAAWRVTDAGLAARGRYLTRPKGRAKRNGQGWGF